MVLVYSIQFLTVKKDCKMRELFHILKSIPAAEWVATAAVCAMVFVAFFAAWVVTP